MQFLTIALFAGAALAGRTISITDVVTITSCHPTVTDCPARSTVTKTTSYAAPVHATVSAAPHPYHNSSIAYSAPVAPYSSAPAPYHSAPGVVTITVNACPAPETSESPAPTTISSVVVPYPTGTGTPIAPAPTATSAPSASNVVPNSPAFTGAASALSGSIALAGFAGLAALIFA